MNNSQHPLDNKLLLGRYRVMRLLGEGGMGTVHLARVEGAEGFTRPVVVKRMKRDIRATEEGGRLFIREAKILSKLQHPGIVGISDFGVEDGAHIMVLEYVHGYTLFPWLEFRHRRNLPLPVEICIFICRRILDALHYAHHFDTEQGREIEIVHRDISPDNILLSNKGYVHLLDFGIASMRGPQGDGATKSNAFRGKLCYAAPETVQGKPATPRSDQYSVGIVLYELLIGTAPFISDSIADTFVRMVNEIPEDASQLRGDVPDGLGAVIARVLAKDPAERFDSALAFSRELRRFQGSDDEDIAHKLGQLVGNEFELLPIELGIESLKVREAALERILSAAPAARPSSELQATIAEPAEPLPAAVAPAGTLNAEPAQKQLRGLLWGILAIGSLIAIGLGAAVALLSRGGTAGEQIVVVGGEHAPSSADPSNANPAALPTQELSIVTTAQPDPGDPAASATSPAPAATNMGLESQSGSRPATASRAQQKPGADQQAKLSKAVQGKSGAFQSCFAKHIKDGKAPPKAVLHFSVAKQGGMAKVKVLPSKVAATPLGHCLKGAASLVRFPPLEKSVAFRVPVRARVSRSKGTQ